MSELDLRERIAPSDLSDPPGLTGLRSAAVALLLRGLRCEARERRLIAIVVDRILTWKLARLDMKLPRGEARRPTARPSARAQALRQRVR